MYKIVQRRKQKRAQQDSGEDTIQTDSDESRSGSDSEGGSVAEESDVDKPLSAPAEESLSEDEELPFISTKFALSQPIQPDPGRPGHSACLICPGKTLKDGKMIEVHISSGV